MTTGYSCRCGAHFARNESDIVERRVLVPSVYEGCQDSATYATYRVCPECGSDRIHAIVLCKRCQKAEPVDGIDVCEPCWQIDEDHWNVVVQQIRARALAEA